MAQKTQESSYSYSKERVRSIYLKDLKRKSIEPDHVLLFKSRRMDIENTPEERKYRAQQWSKPYYHATQDTEQHVSQLDKAIVSLLQCQYSDDLDEDVVISQTCALLSRLPATPHLPRGLSANIYPHPLPQVYFHENQRVNMILDQNTWHKLLVIKWFDTNTIRLALIMVEVNLKAKNFLSNLFKSYIDTIAEILEASFDLLPPCKEAANLQLWVLAQSFLWTCWYRSLMLYFSFNLGRQLGIGYDAQRNSELDMRKPLPENTATSSSSNVVSEYMCTWAFELLKSERASFCQDFRGFHKRFSAVHSQKAGRCFATSHRPCTGQGPKHCQRFAGMTIVDQSAHDFGCDSKCSSLIWDEDSYRNVGGARAVSISDSDESVIRYCQASRKTIAVSHVWAHGAGGRPHTGFNACLHKRLVRLAHENSCDSYWMDTPCIPEDHELRAEAIGNINKIFTTSRMTLVWDRDLMAIDISQTLIETQETILCILLVCDWNVRSWTLLESMRARHNIHLLCKDNRIISFKECLLNVHTLGAIDIANLFLTTQHLLPPQRPSPLNLEPSEGLVRTKEGYISVQESLCLLAYRHASRPGDSTVIMSLLHDITPAYTSEAFWKSKIASYITTGALFSSQPRLQSKGFGWAPAQPEVLANATSAGTQQRLLFDGARTSNALITSGGLLAEFATFEVPIVPFKFRVKEVFRNLAPKETLSSSENRGFGSPRRWAREQFQLDKYRHGMLLLPLDSESVSSAYRAYRGRSNGPIFAAVGSNDKDRRRWHWLGVLEWDPAAPWPKSRSEKEQIFLV